MINHSDLPFDDLLTPRLWFFCGNEATAHICGPFSNETTRMTAKIRFDRVCENKHALFTESVAHLAKHFHTPLKTWSYTLGILENEPNSKWVIENSDQSMGYSHEYLKVWCQYFVEMVNNRIALEEITKINSESWV